MKMHCLMCGKDFYATNERVAEHRCADEDAPTLRPPRKDSLDNSEPPEEGSYHEFVGRMEYRADRRETREWREGNDARLKAIEKRLTLVGLAIAAITAATNGTVPWGKVLRALGW